jgi:uncharacterized membrane protein YqgA involved in biofilm formation
MLGTLINVAAIVLGSTVGVLVHSRLPSRITTIGFQGIGLFTLLIGFTMASKTNNLLVMALSIVSGSMLGEVVNIDRITNNFGDWVKAKVGSETSKFSEGFVTSSLLFCIGSMAILGAIEEGLGGAPNLLLAKSVLDGFSSVALSATLGIGVIFSAIPVLLYQGTLTLLANSAKTVIGGDILNEITAVGGLLLIGLGIDILEIKDIKVSNMLPSLLVAAFLANFLH